MTKNSKSQIRNVVVSSLDIALMAVLEPVIKVLDQHHYDDRGNEAANSMLAAGHDLPSRKDGLLRILLNNFCRDVYQQIYGVNTENYKFAGVKDNWDRAQNAVAQLVNRYSNNPEDMDADPNCAKFYSWYEQSNAKFEMLTSMLTDLKSCYNSITGEEWEYKAPGSTTTKTTISASDAAKKLRERMAQKTSAAA